MRYDLSEVNAVIRDRRTIYPEQFSDREVQMDMVRQILSNATWAPTHGKTEPWRFVIFSGKGREKLGESLKELYSLDAGEEGVRPAKLTKLMRRMELASVIVLMAMKRDEKKKIPEIEEVEAVACAAQNAMLTACAYGLGAFWSSPKFLYNPAAAEHFGFETDDKVLGLLYLGYPEVDWPKSHRKPLEYVSRWVKE